MDQPTNPVDELLPIIAQAVAQWKQRNTVEKISATVTQALDKQAQTILLKLLGFDANHWGKDVWELDHCNGRNGNSAAGDFIRTTQAEAVKAWLSTVAMPNLSPAITKSIVASCRDEYKRALERHIYGIVEKQAEEDAKTLVANISKSNHIDKYLKVMSLINMEPSQA